MRLLFGLGHRAKRPAAARGVAPSTLPTRPGFATGLLRRNQLIRPTAVSPSSLLQQSLSSRRGPCHRPRPITSASGVTFGLGRPRRSAVGSQRVIEANVSEAQTGHCCAS